MIEPTDRPSPPPGTGAAVGRWGALLALLLLAGCAVAGRSLEDVAAEINATLHVDPLILDVEDVIAVEFPNNPDWNQRVPVKSDGFATFTYVGEIQVKGLSESEMIERVKAAYAATLQDSEVTVKVVDWAVRNAYLAGETRGRGAVPITGKRISLVEAIVRAGGHSWRTSRMKRIDFIRWIPEEDRYRRWKLDARVKHWDAPPIYLQPYDIIYVPPRVITVINDWIDQYIRRNIPLPFLFSRSLTTL